MFFSVVSNTENQPAFLNIKFGHNNTNFKYIVSLYRYGSTVLGPHHSSNLNFDTSFQQRVALFFACFKVTFVLKYKTNVSKKLVLSVQRVMI